MKDISKIVKNGKSKATPIGLPFVIERIITIRKIDYESDPVSVSDLVMEGALRLGLENKANAFSRSKSIEATAWLRDGNTASFDPYRIREIYAIQLYKGE